MLSLAEYIKPVVVKVRNGYKNINEYNTPRRWYSQYKNELKQPIRKHFKPIGITFNGKPTRLVPKKKVANKIGIV